MHVIAVAASSGIRAPKLISSCVPCHSTQGVTPVQLAQVEPSGYMDSNGYVGVSWGATDIYTRNGQLSGTGYDSRFVG